MRTCFILGVLLLAALSFSACTKSSTQDAQQKNVESASHEQHQTEEEYYTCPMHPSVRSDRPGACPVCNMALVKKTKQKDLNPSDLKSLRAVSLSATQRVMANISTVKARRHTINREISAVGVVSYAEPNYRHISMRFPGRLEKLYISYTGETIRKGDPVADVYSPEAVTAQQEYLLSLESFEQSKSGIQSIALSTEQLLEQAKNKLLLWGFTERQVERLKDSRKVNYVVTIYSPVSGTVVKKSVDAQHYAATGEDMFDVADLSTVWAYLDVYETDLRFVTKGQQVQMKTVAYPYDEFTGRIIFIDPIVNPETRTVRVRVEFPNRDGKLKPNMYAKAVINVPRTEALVVPSSAIISTGKRTVVWVEVKENAFEQREVMTAQGTDGLVVVLNGLEEGESVAETGGFLIDSESQLGQTVNEHKH